MFMQKKMGLQVASVTLILTVMTFAPYLIPVDVTPTGTPEPDTPTVTVPEPPGMLAYWELNENGGSSVHDSISPYVNGYTVNGPSWITGIAGSGLELHSTQSVNFDSATDLYAVAYLTIEAWVNLQDTSGLHTILMNSYSSKYTMYNFAIEDGHLYFDRQYETPGNAFTSSATMTAGEWHHVAVVMDAGNKKISFYIDGVEEIISNYNDYFSGPAGLVTIGADRPIGTSSFLQGMIDEVAIYNSIVMQSVIEEHYQKGLLGLGYLDDFPPNEAPVANDDSYTMDQDTVMIVDAPGVLVNDIDADSDSLETDFVSGPSNGGLVLNPDGSFVYTPLGGFIEIDAFEYRAFDGVDYSASATVTITVEEVNHPPVAENDAYTTDEDVLLSIASPGVLTNDYDAEPENHITAELVTGPQHGSLTLLPEGDCDYIPDCDWNGIDTFTYRVFDGQVYGNDATVTIT
ncbi:MAG: LamG domain-containing protein, partial [Candidatus Thorarchaeota archaeon]